METLNIIEKPIIVIDRDFDNYFKELVESWIEQKLKSSDPVFKSKKIIIDAAPYRMYAVQCKVEEEGALRIEFYSAIRTGFGSLSKADIISIIDTYL
jgi:hypothetical protein